MENQPQVETKPETKPDLFAAPTPDKIAELGKLVDFADIVPTGSEIKLYVEGESIPRLFELRAVDLTDEAWIRKNFPDADLLEKQLKEYDAVTLSRLTFRLLKNEDKLTYFQASEVIEVDDDGRPAPPRFMPGWERVQRGIRGKLHLLEVYLALLATFGFSRPVLEKIGNKVKDEEKKRIASASIGARSSIQLQAPMVTHTAKSAP